MLGAPAGFAVALAFSPPLVTGLVPVLVAVPVVLDGVADVAMVVALFVSCGAAITWAVKDTHKSAEKKVAFAKHAVIRTSSMEKNAGGRSGTAGGTI